MIDAFNVSAVNQLKIYTLDREGVEALDVPASPLTGTFRTVRPFRGDQKVRGMSIDPTKPDILRAVFASGAAGDSVSDFLMDFEMERLPMSEQDA